MCRLSTLVRSPPSALLALLIFDLISASIRRSITGDAAAQVFDFFFFFFLKRQVRRSDSNLGPLALASPALLAKGTLRTISALSFSSSQH